MKQIHIHIVDDHSLFREGLKFLLARCSFVAHISESENGVEFLAFMKQNNVDVVLMDIEMPQMDGVTATKTILAQKPDVKIIALSMYGYEHYYTRMIDAGACGFLLKNSNFDDVQRAISEVLEGKNYFSPTILKAIIGNMNRRQAEKMQQSELTEREIEILYNICKGFSNAEIAEKLFISKRTVDKHRENLLLKTHAHNTAGLVIFAIRNGLFEI
ncbi:MAG: response regulator transcription factor [Bacteroidales bacterium]|jgi:DNA-binding NarL/FixJ family response regulator|nr:response regulator transcription factor [Bacteroidales bacterium]